jgi:ribonuclease HI
MIAFTDGACSRNGRADARASYSAVIARLTVTDETLFSDKNAYTVATGLVIDRPYALIDDAAPERGYAPQTEAPPLVASNNRGELLGLISAFWLLLQEPAALPCEIISDSRISVLTLDDWLPRRRAAGTAHELKNMDLLTIAESMLARLRTRTTVRLVHVHSHKKAPPASAPARERLLWRGNAIADAHATALLEQK